MRVYYTPLPTLLMFILIRGWGYKEGHKVRDKGGGGKDTNTKSITQTEGIQLTIIKLSLCKSTTLTTQKKIHIHMYTHTHTYMHINICTKNHFFKKEIVITVIKTVSIVVVGVILEMEINKSMWSA